MFNPLNEIKGIVELNKASVIHFVGTANVIMDNNIMRFGHTD